MENAIEEKPTTNKKTLDQIIARVYLGWMLFFFLSTTIFFDGFGPYDLDAMGGTAFAAIIVGALGIPFGKIGGKIGEKWQGTYRSIWVGAIIGTILGSILMGFILILIFISLFGFAQ